MSVTAGGVDNHIGLLVEDNDVVVFINYVQRDIFGQNLFGRQRRQGKFNFIAGTEFKAFIYCFAVDLNGAGGDLLLEQAPAEIAESSVQVFVNPALLDGISDLKRQRPAICIGILYFVSPVLHPAKKEYLYLIFDSFQIIISRADWHQRYLSWYQPAPDCCQQELLLTAAVWFRWFAVLVVC